MLIPITILLIEDACASGDGLRTFELFMSEYSIHMSPRTCFVMPDFSNCALNME